MAKSYKRFLQLLEQWPADTTKVGRDLGHHIREQVKVTFKAGEINPVNEEECNRLHASLKRLADNQYGKMFKRDSNSCASGLSADECKSVLSSEFLEELEKTEQSFFLKVVLLEENIIMMTSVLRRFDRLRNLYFYKNLISTRSCSQTDALKKKDPLHVPVMATEVLQNFDPQPGQIFIDMTFGAGGHSELILKSAPDIKLFVLDRDPVSHSIAKMLAEKFPDQVIPLLGRFSELPELLKPHGIGYNSIDGILFDFGCSSMQFDVAERGFSISKNGPLDMRMDCNRFPDDPTAADVLAHTNEEDLAKILKVYGEEKNAKKIARAVVESRYTFRKLETTAELADLVAAVCNSEERMDKLQRPAHSATKTFQALRIFVNNEINELNYGMILAEIFLKSGGKLVTLTFHSLEDRIVKRHFLGNVIDNAINPLPLKYTDHSLWYKKMR